MWNRLFPKIADNTYSAHWLGIALLFLYTFKSFFAGSIHMFAPDGGAQSIASIALDQFSVDAANTIITIFALWGMEQWIIGIIAVIILVRYKSIIPIAAFVYFLEFAGTGERCSWELKLQQTAYK